VPKQIASVLVGFRTRLVEEPAVKERNTPLETAKTARKRCRGNEEK